MAELSGILSHYEYVAAGGENLSEEEFDQGGFTRSAVSYDEDELAFVYSEGN